jgi:hypothetical protein
MRDPVTTISSILASLAPSVAVGASGACAYAMGAASANNNAGAFEINFLVVCISPSPNVDWCFLHNKRRSFRFEIRQSTLTSSRILAHQDGANPGVFVHLRLQNRAFCMHAA